MKNITLTLLIIVFSGMLLSSCNEKLNIAAPYKNITVVYGLLNRADTAHYIRIQKAFMDENKSAIDLAKVADSNFYQSLSVIVKEMNGNLVLNTINLNRVDLLNEGYPKDSGAFFNTPSYAYKFKYNLNPTNSYRVIITNNNTGVVDSAETPIIDNSLPFTQFGIIEWQRFNETINFSRILTPAGKTDFIEYSVVVPPKAAEAEVVIRFNWTDSNIVTGAATRKFADFNGFELTSSIDPNKNGQTVSMQTQNKNLYDFLSAVMGTPEINQYRYLDSCDAYLYVAGTEYKRYKDLNRNVGGLTADEIKPLYTNIKGTDVMGLFSTRSFKTKSSIPLSEATRDSLQTNPITRGLNLRFYP